MPCHVVPAFKKVLQLKVKLNFLWDSSSFLPTKVIKKSWHLKINYILTSANYSLTFFSFRRPEIEFSELALDRCQSTGSGCLADRRHACNLISTSLPLSWLAWNKTDSPIVQRWHHATVFVFFCVKYHEGISLILILILLHKYYVHFS